MLVQLRSRVGDAKKLIGKQCTEADASLWLTGDADVYMPNGEPLCMLRRAVIPPMLMDDAYEALHSLRKYKTDNRGSYAGAARVAAFYKDRSRSSQTRTRDATGKIYSVASAIIGYFDKQGGRFPFCRETKFTAEEVDRWRTILPMIHFVADLFKRELPARYAAQKDACDACVQAYIIKGTPFSTLTVNNNVAPGAVHTDKGDFKQGMGVLSYVCKGDYSGGAILFPEYKVAVEPKHGDVLFFNPHELHAITPMVKHNEDAERISIVYYLRSKMRDCLAPGEQLEKLRARE